MPSYSRPLYTTTFKNAVQYAENAAEWNDGNPVVFPILLKTTELKLLDLNNKADCNELVRKNVIPAICENDIYGTSFYQIGMELVNQDIILDADDPWLSTEGGKYFKNKASKISPYDIDDDNSSEIVHSMFFNNLKQANLQINAIREYGTYQNDFSMIDDAIVIVDNACIDKVIIKYISADLAQYDNNEQELLLSLDYSQQSKDKLLEFLKIQK